MTKQEIINCQSNKLTEGRYPFNVMQKRVIYCIARQVRQDYIETQRGPETYSNMRVFLDEKILTEIADETNHAAARKALRSLRERSLELTDDEGNWCVVGFINVAKYIAKDKLYMVEVSEEIMPHLVNLASQYTTYSLTIAVSLKSKWSQRMYELCCQYRNINKNGYHIFYKTIKQLREMFMLENKYVLLSAFKQNVLDKAANELKLMYDAEQCDLWFEYNQTGKGDKARFEFQIHTRKEAEELKKKMEDQAGIIWSIYKILSTILPKDPKFCEKCRKHIEYHPEKVQPLYLKLNALMERYKGNDLRRITRYVLDEDFGMNNKSI